MARRQSNEYWVGFDLGGTKMLAELFDKDFKVVGRARRRTRAREGVKAGIKRLVETIERALNDGGLSAGDLSGIGVGVPGPLEPETGTVSSLPNLGWENVGLKKELEKVFGRPVAVVNDVDAGVFGEYMFGAGRKARCVVGVFPGTGIGGGCVYCGEIMRGSSVTCMEFGHMEVVRAGALCGCGKRGCLETVASRLAISAAAASAAYRGEAPNLLASSGMDLANIRSGALRDAIAAGDTVVEAIVRDAARWLGVGIGNVINLLAPDVVVLGGGLVEAMPKLYLEEVVAATARHAMPVYAGKYRIVAAALGDQATAMGAAAWCRRTSRNGAAKEA